MHEKFILLTGHSQTEPYTFVVPPNIVYVKIARCARTTSPAGNKLLNPHFKSIRGIISFLKSRNTHTKFTPGRLASDMIVETFGNDKLFHGSVKLPLSHNANMTNRNTIRANPRYMKRKIKLSAFLKARSDYLLRQIAEGVVPKGTKYYVIVNACSGIPGMNITNENKTVTFESSSNKKKKFFLRIKKGMTLENTLRNRTTSGGSERKLPSWVIREILPLYELEKRLHNPSTIPKGRNFISNTKANVHPVTKNYLNSLTPNQFKEVAMKYLGQINNRYFVNSKGSIILALNKLIESRPNLNISRTVQNIKQRVRVGGRGTVEYL